MNQTRMINAQPLVDWADPSLIKNESIIYSEIYKQAGKNPEKVSQYFSSAILIGLRKLSNALKKVI